MKPDLFVADIEAVPAHLAALADVVEHWPVLSSPRRILMLGMGSSYFAAIPVAARMRAGGLDAVAELASNTLTWPPAPDLLVVAISATGRSAETLAAVEPHLGVSRVIALTNDTKSPLAARADVVVAMHAGVEAGGVACRTYRHTIAQLLVLSGVEVAPALRLAAAASADLLDRRAVWLPQLLAALDSADGLWLLAPAERQSSALQGALMVREGPRRRADACETGDWSHVDVYLTKTLDYRALVFAGSPHEAAAAEWMARRGSTAVAVGGSFPGAQYELRYDGDDDPIVALLTEVLVAELVAASWWS
jgi:glucosamine--fructose-6-phosphate aminotransferase (isomerizing)